MMCGSEGVLAIPPLKKTKIFYFGTNAANWFVKRLRFSPVPHPWRCQPNNTAVAGRQAWYIIKSIC